MTTVNPPDRWPLVSILIVTWNRREVVARSIRSAMEQTYPHTEIVVVDNGSEDGTPDAIASEFPAVRLVRLPKNVGCPPGRNRGFAHCKGEFIYQLDDDGWLAPDAVAAAVRTALADPTIAAVRSLRLEVADGKVFARIPPITDDQVLYLATFAGGCSMLRARALDEVGAYPDDFFRQAEEDDLAIRLLDRGYCCVLEPRSVMYHEPSPVGRSSRTAMYHVLRNTSRTALRLWPFPWCCTRVVQNVLRAVRYGVILRFPALPFLIAWGALVDLGQLRRRRPVSRAAYRLFRTLERGPWRTNPVLELRKGKTGSGG